MGRRTGGVRNITPCSSAATWDWWCEEHHPVQQRSHVVVIIVCTSSKKCLFKQFRVVSIVPRPCHVGEPMRQGFIGCTRVTDMMNTSTHVVG